MDDFFVNKDSSFEFNCRNKLNGLTLLSNIKDSKVSACFFDPQYRGILDKMKYGNEDARQKERAKLSPMSDEVIIEFIKEISRVLKPSGHLFLWIDKFHLCTGVNAWLNDNLRTVDLITWDKKVMGMGYRTRRQSEYLLVVQKLPLKAKDVWLNHSIRDVWSEKIEGRIHTHQKPLTLQEELIKSVSHEGDVILDPCSGSYSVFEACKNLNRNFIGCDLI